MLYLSTKNQYDTYTAYRAIHSDAAPDGGMYVPFRLPHLDADAVRSLSQKSTCANMAEILNLFFGTGITELDLEYVLGRNHTRLSTMAHRVIIGELWHNVQWNYENTVRAVSDTLRREGMGDLPSDWVETAVRIASIFALYGQTVAEGVLEQGEMLDIAVPVGDFSAPMAAWYARKMGLPIGVIICGCNENSALWDLMNLADMSTGDTVAETLTPLCDHQVPPGLPRLVFETLGLNEALRFDEVCKKGRHFAPAEDQFDLIKSGFFTAVSSISRIDSVIRNVNSTTGYVLSPYDALAYGALLDYRSKSGQGSTCLLISERCPICDDKTTAYALGISAEELATRLQSR